MFTIPSAICVGIVVVAFLLRAFHRRKSIRYIRGPPRFLSLLGHDYLMNLQDEVGDLDFKWLAEFGSTWRIQGAFRTDVIMTADPKAIQHIYHKSAYNYAKKQSQNHMSYLMAGPGIVWSQGEDHQRHRKIMNPAFSAAHLRSFLPLFQRVTGKLVEKWKAELATTSEFESLINNWISRAALDIIGQAAFDYDYGVLEDAEQSTLAKAYHGILKDAEFRLPGAMMLFRAAWDYIPVPVLKLFQYLPVDPFTRILSLRRLYISVGKQILREKRPELDAEKRPNSKDIMSILIKANASSEAKTRLNDDELMAEMYTLTLAGHETTATTISFLMYQLSLHPEYQARMRQEIREVRARVTARTGIDFTMEDLDNMPLCLNAIKETLRFHPIVSYLPRVASKDDVLPLMHPIISATGETITEIPISKGQTILTSFAAYNRLPQVWGEDSHVWNPDRFFRIDVGKQTNVGMFANLMTFSAGVRGCIGWRFSIIETQALVAELLENFQFRLPAGADPAADHKNSELQCAPSGAAMVPLIRGKPELGPSLRLRVSLAPTE
ncbi:PAH-inducible cytochrome P450 monooxygenase PC-PAH 4 [Trametes versicolor FP-101664 SS1]|uniref:PAH-inducible cytochrome P450 monooxygenase PC-PAH 4 n=1 Tax=Trametes versicolor (strain FP-101664) TaxID=717944 RepID=UPI0004623BB4|nr:PAH-inducible cytochrome P450 monooxygenase PC-PAH 4 [Trametes versicolor FP-101664 SS1]EIW62975.1 PAH-inducible cytochrome P450 monooxygenase PC-PAH 4 [Trametes versicolor FP-101664 SS1]